MKNLKSLSWFAAAALSVLGLITGAVAQSASQDSYTDTATPTTNFGIAATLGVVSSAASIQNTYIQFDLSAIPADYRGANVAKATLKLYVNAVTTAGNFNVDFVNGSWTEKTITANLAPALGSTIVSSVPLTVGSVHDYVLIDVTAAVADWLNGTQVNDGIALVANSPLNASFDSKENTTQSHPAELELVLTGNGTGTITGVTTASGSGLSGGGNTGTLNMSLIKSCASGQVLQWNGTAWVCSGAGSGTVTSVASGTGLTGGPITSSGALSIDRTKIPLLNTANTFTGNQTVNGDVTASGTLTAGIMNAARGFDLGGKSFASGSTTSGSVFVGFSGNTASTGSSNTAIGAAALFSDTSGTNNTASGFQSLELNTTGTSNTAAGYSALVDNTTGNGNTAAGYASLYSNTTGGNNSAFGYYAGNTTNQFPTTGSNNTFVGFYANPGAQTTLSNATAIGANAQVTASNAMVLGSISGVNGATASTNVGIGTTVPATLLHLNRAVPPGGSDVLAITSGGSIDVASLLVQNTSSSGMFLRAGAGTGEAYLASNGPLAFITAGTNVPSFPGTPVMSIDKSGNVDVSSGLMRIDIGGISLGGAAPLAVDAPGVVGGRFTVLANGNVGIGNPAPSAALTVTGEIRATQAIITQGPLLSRDVSTGNLAASSVIINGDTPMSSAPRMTFSGSIPGGLCNFFNCGTLGGNNNNPGPGGFIVPDKNITVTRVTVAIGDLIDPSCVDTVNQEPGVLLTGPSTGSYYLQLLGNTQYVDSGPIAFSVPAGTMLAIQAVPVFSACSVGKSAGGNLFVNVQYVMQ